MLCNHLSNSDSLAAPISITPNEEVTTEAISKNYQLPFGIDVDYELIPYEHHGFAGVYPIPVGYQVGGQIPGGILAGQLSAGLPGYASAGNLERGPYANYGHGGGGYGGGSPYGYGGGHGGGYGGGHGGYYGGHHG